MKKSPIKAIICGVGAGRNEARYKKYWLWRPTACANRADGYCVPGERTQGNPESIL